MKILRSITIAAISVLFLLPTSATTAQQAGFFSAGDLDQASANIIVYRSESDFLNAAPIVSTETFDEFPSGTGFLSPQVVIDQVVYETDGPCVADERPNPCWVVGIHLGPGYITPPNDFGATFGNGITEHRISFGTGNAVRAFGFWFLSGASFPPPAWEVIVHEIDGTDTIETLQLVSGQQYLGFVSDVGIRALTVRAGDGGGNWSYDNISRSQVLSRDLDPTFGEAGKLILPNISGANKNGLAIQPDGKLLLAAGTAILRLLPDGSLDSSFDGDGRAETGLDGPGALILQPDGKILVVGTVNASSRGIRMARYLADGSPDLSFGDGGGISATYAKSITGSAAVLQPDGKILVSGEVVTEEPINDNNYGFFVARFSPDGSLDLSFDQDGFGINLFTCLCGENYLFVNDLAVLPDGKIVAVGEFGDDFSSSWRIRRFNPDGSFDAAINTPPRGPCRDCFDEALAVVVQPDGKFLVGGAWSIPDENEDPITQGFYLLRFNLDASLDPSFGKGGEVFTNFPSSNFDYAYDITLQEDGKVIAAGTTQWSDFALARYHPDGSLDESFGEAGLVTTDFGAGEVATTVALQPDGKIVAAGHTEGGLAMARYFSSLEEQRIDVTIDIRPGSLRNTIVLGKTRVISVAILSRPDFDARLIDKPSLTFGSTGDEHSLIMCNRGVNVNHDRFLDTLCYFRTRLTGFQVGDSEGILRGQTRDGIPIEGHDQVKVRRVGEE